MRSVALIGLLIFGLSANAEAGRRGGGRSHAPRGHSGMSGTGSSPHSHAVRGYTTKRGTYVAPHHQTNPGHT